ncbi:MAG: BON domain-containing protein [Terriglobia bacterium]
MKISKDKYLIIAPLVGALLFGACSRSPNDQEIVSQIQAKLYQQPDLKSLSINVASDKGVVTLSGSVNAPLERLAVEDLAQQTQGVKQVVDQIALSNSIAAAPPAPAAPARPPEEAYAARVIHRRHHVRRADPANSEQPSEDGAGTLPSPNGAPTPSEIAQAQQPPAPAAQPAPAPPPPPQLVQVTIPSGTPITVRMIDSIGSETAQPGQTYAASLFASVVVGNRVVIPQGADAKVRVVQVESAGRYQGQSQLEVELVGLSINGTNVPVETGYYNKVGASRGKNTAEKIGGGAGLGALLGAIIGHGKGAGIGAAIGGAAGTADQTATRGQQVTIPSEAKIDFTLKGPVTVTLNPDESGGAAQ